jgi:GT2 family glycosyltransferase
MHGEAADYLPEMQCIPLRFRLRAGGQSTDRKALFLGDRYLDCRIDRRSLIRGFRSSMPMISELRVRAAARARNLLERFSWKRTAGELAECVAAVAEGHEAEPPHPGARVVMELRPLGNVAFSVLVNSLNRPDLLLRWLDHLIHLPDFGVPDTEVVIVDDGSHPSYETLRADLVSFAAGSPRPFNLRLARLDENCGNAIARNSLLALAEGRRALFLGDDILPMPGMLQRHAQAGGQHQDRTLLLGHTEWHPRLRNNLIAEFTTKGSGFQFNYEAIRNREVVPLTNLFTSNVSFDPQRIRDCGAFFEPVPGVRLWEDTLWGAHLDREGFRLVYDRKAEALHDHEISYRWFCERSRVIGSTAVRYYALFPSTKAFTGIEGRLEILRRALARPHHPPRGPERYEKSLRRAIEDLQPRIPAAPSWSKRLILMRDLYSRLYESYQHYLMQGMAESLCVSERQKHQAAAAIMRLTKTRLGQSQGSRPE